MNEYHDWNWVRLVQPIPGLSLTETRHSKIFCVGDKELTAGACKLITGASDKCKIATSVAKR